MVCADSNSGPVMGKSLIPALGNKMSEESFRNRFMSKHVLVAVWLKKMVFWSIFSLSFGICGGNTCWVCLFSFLWWDVIKKRFTRKSRVARDEQI
ncbi:hypothetical protein CDAR_434311 [Caerostris darwini]|uniref:Transmembrane protein n=1 Tax=Caerostris darwini TaxID=1538125 RepID=A0AAV4UA46_9ARAC|nr:hypothetical protein CDAR_434311 [Caerostris darwini]